MFQRRIKSEIAKYEKDKETLNYKIYMDESNKYKIQATFLLRKMFSIKLNFILRFGLSVFLFLKNPKNLG